ncbi:vacuolar aminopeptidase 1 [Acrodontium crateriforme]|uniref:Vacuolar aminopeptidase 1 n=1 Tax=Acrodontium crateriforme TaxID=150365 RepID=A0AAQ3M9F8_9PEZI|nr:vacuolar aminopeptidase 1 [Acrodontium crateriforme]
MYFISSGLMYVEALFHVQLPYYSRYSWMAPQIRLGQLIRAPSSRNGRGWAEAPHDASSILHAYTHTCTPTTTPTPTPTPTPAHLLTPFSLYLLLPSPLHPMVRNTPAVTSLPLRTESSNMSLPDDHSTPHVDEWDLPRGAMMDDTFVRNRNTQPPSESPHWQQDLQLELMLLEHENKRRLLMAKSTPQDFQSRKQHPPFVDRPRRATRSVAARRAAVAQGRANAQPRYMTLRENARSYIEPFLTFMTDSPTVFHAVDAMKAQLKENGFKELNERREWDIQPGGRYVIERNGSSIIAFSVGNEYKSGNGAAIVAGHIDALTAKLKPISTIPTKAGFLQLGVAPYAGGLGNTWWDRDLGVGGRVLVKQGDKVVSKLVKLDWPIAKVPTLAPHFGAAANGPFNLETQMVPIIGLESDEKDVETYGNVGSFVATQPPKLVKAIGKELGLSTKEFSNIMSWELELFDVQPAATSGIDREKPDFISAGRIDDKLCSWAAIQALCASQSYSTQNSSVIKVVACFDNEEIGSLTRQGAHGNFLQTVLERAVENLDHNDGANRELIGRTYANSFLVSSDVCHAVNPNFLNVYLENHAPKLNVGVAVSADPNGHMTTDAVSTAIFKRCADKVGAELQWFQIRNDSRSGGTVGPMLSAATGIRAIDAGIPQLSMHSIRATTGSLDPGLGVITFQGFLDEFEFVDEEFGAEKDD